MVILTWDNLVSWSFAVYYKSLLITEFIWPCVNAARPPTTWPRQNRVTQPIHVRTVKNVCHKVQQFTGHILKQSKTQRYLVYGHIRERKAATSHNNETRTTLLISLGQFIILTLERPLNTLLPLGSWKRNDWNNWLTQNKLLINFLVIW